MERLHRRALVNFRPGARLAAPVRYRFAVTGVVPGTYDLLVQGDQAVMEPAVPPAVVGLSRCGDGSFPSAARAILAAHRVVSPWLWAIEAGWRGARHGSKGLPWRARNVSSSSVAYNLTLFVHAHFPLPTSLTPWYARAERLKHHAGMSIFSMGAFMIAVTLASTM